MWQVPDSGFKLLLAQAQAPDEFTQNAINVFANDNPAYTTADIGSTPPFFKVTIDGYQSQHIDILKLTFFTMKILWV